jgi:hypothetical protein
MIWHDLAETIARNKEIRSISYLISWVVSHTHTHTHTRFPYAKTRGFILERDVKRDEDVNWTKLVKGRFLWALSWTFSSRKAWILIICWILPSFWRFMILPHHFTASQTRRRRLESSWPLKPQISNVRWSSCFRNYSKTKHSRRYNPWNLKTDI